MEAEAVVRQFYQALSTGDGSLLDEILADDWEDIPLPPGTGPGRENFKAQGLTWVRAVFPDFTVDNQDIIVSADGSKVVVRSVSGGTQKGELFGIPATGKRVEFRAVDIHELKDGVIVRTWHLEDFLGAAMALGAQVVPPQPSADVK
jgi:predicted ester cyclase